MKLFLAILIVFFLVLSVFLAFSLLSFHPDSFRPLLQQELSKALGTEVLLGKISVRWGISPSFHLAGLEMRHPETHEKLLQTPSARAQLNLRSLLKHRIHAQTLLLERPVIYWNRKQNGEWNWAPWMKRYAEARETELSALKVKWIGEGFFFDFARPGHWEFSISEISLLNGVLHYSDASALPAFQFDLQNLSAQLLKPDPQRPYELELNSETQNQELSPLKLKAAYQPSENSVSFLASLGGQKMVMQAALTPDLIWKGSFETHQLDLSNVPVAQQLSSGESLEGILTSRLQISGQGTHPSALKKALAAQGSMDVRRGSLKNINFVRGVLIKLSPIPGFTELLNGPQEKFSEGLLGKDTRFDLLQASVQILEGRLFLDNLRLQHPFYLMEAEGSLGLIQPDVDFRSRLVLYEDLSNHLVKKDWHVKSLVNPAGRIVLPFAYRGLLPSASLFLDLNYISNRLSEMSNDPQGAAGLQALSELMR